MSTSKKKNLSKEKIVNAREEQYCLNILEGMDQSAAYRNAFSPGKANKSTIRKLGWAVGHRPHVQRRLAELRKPDADRARERGRALEDRWWAMVNADPNEIMQVRYHCCRFCYGIDGNYQFTKQEYALKQAAVIDKNINKDGALVEKILIKLKLDKDPPGGFGFDKSRLPNAQCTECNGVGEKYLFMQDGRKLKGGARLLYAGARPRGGGIEILLHDQIKIGELLAKYYGMFKDKENSTPPPLVPDQYNSKDPLEIEREYQNLMGENKK